MVVINEGFVNMWVWNVYKHDFISSTLLNRKHTPRFLSPKLKQGAQSMITTKFGIYDDQHRANTDEQEWNRGNWYGESKNMQRWPKQRSNFSFYDRRECYNQSYCWCIGVIVMMNEPRPRSTFSGKNLNCSSLLNKYQPSF